MELRSIPRIAWAVVAVALLVAMMRLPYGYYTFTRILTCGFCLVVALFGFEVRAAKRAIWTVIFVIVAIVFNPLIPIHLNSYIWPYLDFAAAVVVMTHLLLVRQRLA